MDVERKEVYLGAIFTSDNKMSREVTNRIMAGKKAYFANLKLL